MLAHPRLKRSFRPAVIEPGLLFLMSEHSELVFEGPAYVALAPLLDGTRSVAEILAAAAGKAPWPSLYAALALLERKGCLAEGNGLPDGASAAFWDYLGVGSSDAVGIAGATRLSVRAVGGLSAEAVKDALGQAGLVVADEADADVMVVATSDYLLPDLRAINERALAESRRWALLKPVGTIVWVGPIFRPGATGCWECLVQRLKFNRQVEHYLGRRTAREAPVHVARGWLKSSEKFGASLAATELARWLVAPPEESLEGRLLTFDLIRRESALHVLVKRPQCPACGSGPESGAPRPVPVMLTSRPKVVGEASRERAATATETFERYKHHVSPITGIVTSLMSREPTEHGVIHNYAAGHYFPVPSDDLAALRLNLVARSGGKGLTAAQAKTGALCEALERYSGIAWGDEPRIRASYEALRSEAVHIRELSLFSDAQYASREVSKATSEYHDVPPPPDDRAEVSWTPVWSLSRGRTRYLPTAYCYYGFRDPGQFFTRCDSNGCAAGSSLEEAVLYGFLELLERDSVALWWYNRLRRPAVDARSFGLPYWEEMERHYRQELHRDLHALDLTSDLGIPAIAVVSRRTDREVEDVILGFAAHLDPAAALLQAVKETNQYLPSVREEGPDRSTRYRQYSEETVHWWKTATYANQPWLVPDPEAPPRRASDFPHLSTHDYGEDAQECLRAAEGAGLEVLVLDQTRPDVGLPVVRVVVPGMRHFWRRLGPGRLYDVPVKLGWREGPLREDEMNPISCFV